MSSTPAEPPEPMDPSKLTGVWFRSPEEEEGDRIVYRGTSFEFPPARAPRPSMRLEPDGSVAVGSAGPTEDTVSTPGTWDVSGNVLTLSTSGAPTKWTIETLEDDLLVLRREAEEEESDG